MRIQVTCPQCGKRYAVPPSMAGHTGACACGAIIPIAAAPSPSRTVVSAGILRMASVRQRAADEWPSLRQNAWPVLRMVLGRPWLPAAAAAWLLSTPLLPWHTRLMPYRRPDNVLLLLADVWLYAGVAALVIALSRRYASRPLTPTAGLLAGYAAGLLVLVGHGLSLSSPGLHWPAGLWHSYAGLRQFTALLVGGVAGAASVWLPALLVHPPAAPAFLRTRLDRLRPRAKLWQSTGIMLAWLWPTVLTIGLHTQFRCVPVKPWAHPSQAPGHWLALLLVPTLFGLWTVRQRSSDQRVAGGPTFAFVGVQVGLLGALTIWPYPSWQRETAVVLSAVLGLLGANLALVAVPQPSAVASRGPRWAPAFGLVAVGAVLGLILIGFVVNPAWQVRVWRRAAVTTNLPNYAAARLAATRGPNAVRVLMDTLGDQHPNVAQAAEKALTHLDPPMVRALAAMLPEATLRQRCWATHFLGESKRPEAVKPLLAALREELPPAQRDVELEQEQLLSANSSPPNPIAAEARQRQEREQARYHNPPVRGTGLPPEYMCHTYSAETLRAVAVRALAKIDDPEVGPAVAAALNDPSPSVRRTALTAMVTLHYPPAIPTLRRMLEEGSSSERALAAEALTMMGDLEIVLPLIKLLKSGDSPEVKAAARSLMKVRDRRALEPLGQALIRGASDTEGLGLLLTAYETLGGNTLMPLLAAADNPEPHVRDFAACKLGEKHAAEGAAHFARLLNDPQRAEQAGLVLRRMATPEARAALRAHGWPDYW